MNARPLLSLAAATTALVALTACGGSETNGADDASGASAKGFPVTVENCGVEVTFDRPPERIVLLSSDSVTYLHELGVLDRVVARAGAYPEAYYDDETLAELNDIDLLTDDLDASGHLQISKEAVLAQKPDLVMGESDNLNRETLGAVGIPQLIEPAMCPEGVADPGFADIAEQMKTYGKVFGVPDEGTRAASEVSERVEAITSETDDSSGEPRTAAVLYPTVGGGTTYAYGTQSMAQPQLEAAGFENVFGDVDERVFEVTREELIGRNPDVLVLLYSDGDPDDVKKAITSMSGAGTITAVAQDDILVQLFNFTEPPSMLSIDGLEHIVERFGA